MSGKRYRQRRRWIRRGGTAEGWSDRSRRITSPDWSLTIGAMFDRHATEALFSGPYSTPMGYADPLNRDSAVEAYVDAARRVAEETLQPEGIALTRGPGAADTMRGRRP